jgi:hypothetical protein
LSAFYSGAGSKHNQESPIQVSGRHFVSVGSAVLTFVERNFYRYAAALLFRQAVFPELLKLRALQMKHNCDSGGPKGTTLH